MEDPFKVLGVQADADDKQVKKAYRRLALKCASSRWFQVHIVVTLACRLDSCCSTIVFPMFRTWCELPSLYAPDATSLRAGTTLI
jgi:hypothetical protein